MVSLKFISAGMLLWALQAPGLEAIPSYSGGGTFGYVTGGAGFAFSPRTKLSITALGGVPMDQPQDALVTLWDHNGLPLVSALITSNSVLTNWARYEAITPVTAFAGQTYYVRLRLAPGSLISEPGWGRIQTALFRCSFTPRTTC